MTHFYVIMTQSIVKMVTIQPPIVIKILALLALKQTYPKVATFNAIPKTKLSVFF